MSLYFFTSNEGLIGGSNGYFAKTTDGGETWRQINIGVETGSNYINNMVAINDIVYLSADSILYQSTDHGDTWSYKINFHKVINKIDFVSELIGYVLESSMILHKTTDGGETWNEIFNNSSTSGFYVFDENSIIVTNFFKKIFRTYNGGNTWDKQKINYSIACPIFRENLGWATDLDSNIYFSNDSGKTWTPQLKTSVHIWKIHVFNINNIWAPGSKGTIIKGTQIPQTSVDELQSDEFINITQSSDNLILSYSIENVQDVSSRIVDVFGTTKYSGIIENNSRINISSFPQGVYFLQLNIKDRQFVKKFCIVR